MVIVCCCVPVTPAVSQRLRRDERVRNDAALWIQSRWRAHRGQLSTQVLKQARQMRREYNAATFVQAHWRGRMGRDILRHLRVEVSAVLRCVAFWAACIACER